MKNTMLSVLVFSFIVLWNQSVFANVTIDQNEVSNGVVGIQYTGDFSKPIKVTVEKDSVRYIYTLKNTTKTYVPLQMGAGSYKVSVMMNVDGNKYKSLAAENITASKMDGLKMFTYSTPITTYNNGMKSVQYYTGLISGKGEKEKVDIVYSDVTKNYIYDQAKANSVADGYVPNIEEIFGSKKGICYDYSALMAGALRGNGVPVKLVMGYAPEIKEYHAWNEIYVDGKWQVVDATYDAAMVAAGKKVSFAKDASKFKVLKVY